MPLPVASPAVSAGQMPKRGVDVNSPEYDVSTPVDREYEARLHDHYGRPVYG